MGDEQPGEPLLLEQPQRLFVEVLASDLVDGAEGLVEHQDRRLERQRAGQRAAHAHAARQRLGVVILETGEPDEVDGVAGERPAFGPRESVQLGEQLDVVLDRAPRHQRRILEHVADALAVDADVPRGRLEQARGDLEQRRLAAPRRPDHRHELAPVDLERHVVDGVRAVGEHHPDVVERQRGHRLIVAQRAAGRQPLRLRCDVEPVSPASMP